MAKTRTFIAIDCGDSTRHRAGTVQKTLSATGAGIKWVDAATLHITLLFLGEVSDNDLASVCRIVQKAAARHSAFPLTFRGISAFPTPRRPKILWAGVTDGAENLLSLHKAMEEPLLELGCYRQEDRPYTPHLTLGRVQGEADSQLLAAELPKFKDWDGGQSIAEEILIMGSELRKSGPEYTVIGRANLSSE